MNRNQSGSSLFKLHQSFLFTIYISSVSPPVHSKAFNENYREDGERATPRPLLTAGHQRSSAKGAGSIPRWVTACRHTPEHGTRAEILHSFNTCPAVQRHGMFKLSFQKADLIRASAKCIKK